MNKNSFSKLIEKLSGLEWCFMSGFAVEIYTHGKRKAGEDVDVLISPKDVKTLAKRLNCQVEHRHFKKENFFVNDYGFETTLYNLKIEVSSGFPQRRMKSGSIYKVFQKRIAKKYRGINLFVEPIEELIVHKASMFREKDIRDLKLLMDKEFDRNFLKELAKNWGKQSQILRNLKSLGYEIA